MPTLLRTLSEMHHLVPVGLEGIGALLMLFVPAFMVDRIVSFVVRRTTKRLNMAAEAAADDQSLQLRMRKGETHAILIGSLLKLLVWGLTVMSAFIMLLPHDQSGVIAISLVVAVFGFAAQPFIRDLIAGATMAVEKWYAVGDVITVEPWAMQGIVEHVGLRSTRLRSLTGEEVWVHNSFIYGAKVARHGVREMAIEVFARDRDAVVALVDEVSRTLPQGPTHLVTPLRVAELEHLETGDWRIQARANIVPGREWLMEDLACKMFTERAADGLIAHGPISYYTDQVAVNRYTRSAAALVID